MDSEQPRYSVITHLSAELKTWCIEQSVEADKSLAAWIRHRLSMLRAEEEEDPDFIED